MDDDGGSCPVARSSHAAVCLNYGGDDPQFLVFGGWNDEKKVLGDVWILDLETRRWREVRGIIHYLYLLVS